MTTMFSRRVPIFWIGMIGAEMYHARPGRSPLTAQARLALHHSVRMLGARRSSRQPRSGDARAARHSPRGLCGQGPGGTRPAFPGAPRSQSRSKNPGCVSAPEHLPPGRPRTPLTSTARSCQPVSSIGVDFAARLEAVSQLITFTHPCPPRQRSHVQIVSGVP